MHCDGHPRWVRGNEYEQVRDAWSCLGYCSNRKLAYQPAAGGTQYLQVEAGTAVFLSARALHAGAMSDGDDGPMVFMYLDRSYRLPGDNGLEFANSAAVPADYTVSIHLLRRLQQVYPEMLDKFSGDRPDPDLLQKAEKQVQEAVLLEHFFLTQHPTQ